MPGSLTLKECNAAIHKKCIDKIIGRCTGTAANSRDTIVSWDQGLSGLAARGSPSGWVTGGSWLSHLFPVGLHFSRFSSILCVLLWLGVQLGSRGWAGRGT